MKIQYQNENLIVFESALFRTTSSIIVGEQYILLVDPNWLPIEIDFIENWILKFVSRKAKYLLFTHSDYDHIIGYGKFKNYKTIASQNFINNTEKISILNQIKEFDDQYYVKRDYKIEYPKIDIPISGEAITINIGSDEYVLYQARGHNKDGIITYNKTKNVLIVGDYLSNIEFPYLYDSLAFYKETLNKLEEIIESANVQILIPGHGDVSTDHEEMQKRIKESRDYLSDLEHCIRNEEEFALSDLFRRYEFSGIMKKFHKGNIDLVRKELKQKAED